jgi:hypothetical protein
VPWDRRRTLPGQPYARLNKTASSVFDAAACATIGANYRLDSRGSLVEDEAMRCRGCGFESRFPGTPVSAWRRRSPETEPPVVELCEIGHAAAEALVRFGAYKDPRRLR